MTNEAEPPTGPAKVTLTNPQGLMAVFSDLATIDNTNDAVYLSFYQVDRPPLTEAGERGRQSEVPAICFARIVMSPLHAMRIRDVLDRTIKRMQSHGELPDEEMEALEDEE
jgi:hypothetical protein